MVSGVLTILPEDLQLSYQFTCVGIIEFIIIMLNFGMK